MNDFTPRARQVIQLARNEAERFNHQYVGTEHLLLGLIALGEGVAVNVLEQLGVDLEALRLEVEKAVGQGPETKVAGTLPLTPRAKKVLALANCKISELCKTYPNVHLIDIHSEFLGHGIHCDELWRRHYRKDDPHFWFYYNLEDPNRRGFDAIRRLYMQSMIHVFWEQQR